MNSKPSMLMPNDIYKAENGVYLVYLDVANFNSLNPSDYSAEVNIWELIS